MKQIIIFIGLLTLISCTQITEETVIGKYQPVPFEQLPGDKDHHLLINLTSCIRK